MLLKRIVDVVMSAAALVTLSPVILIVAILIRLRLGSPVLFYQWRPGLHGEPFRLVKFRTMLDAPEGAMSEAGDRPRMTPFGRRLRATSLDELPELVNVLRGEMSLVGPRPLLMQYLPLYSAREARRMEVRPGLTGWAQVNGRNAIGWDERFDLDVWYVDNRSFALDMRILWLTIVAVVRRDGINANEDTTMRPFTGSARKGDAVESEAPSAPPV